MRKSCLIAFVGPVGSGKSTQIKLIARYLRSKGLKVRTTYLKVGNLWAYSLYKIALMGWPIFKNKWLFKLWIILDIFAISLKFLFSILIPLKRECIVLVEEYLPATVADYFHIAKINGRLSKDVRVILAYACRLAMLVPFTSIFLDANSAVLRRRWKLRGTITKEKNEYLLMQRRLVLSLAILLSHRFIYIDTSNDVVKETNRRLKEYLIALTRP